MFGKEVVMNIINLLTKLVVTAIAVIAFNTNSAPLPQPLMVTIGGDGVVMSEPAGISCPDDCYEVYPKRTIVTLTATAATNGIFLGWEGACVGTSPVCVIKMKEPTNVTALFDGGPVVYSYRVVGDGWTGAPLQLTDNGDGTFTDENTGLMWEIKLPPDDPACVAVDQIVRDVHCSNNEYSWAQFADGEEFNGTVKTEFLDMLNSGTFAGYTDWRLPTTKEVVSLADYRHMNNPVAPTNYIPGWPVGLSWTSTTQEDPYAYPLIQRSYKVAYAAALFGGEVRSAETAPWLDELLFPNPDFIPYGARAVRDIE